MKSRVKPASERISTARNRSRAAAGSRPTSPLLAGGALLLLAFVAFAPALQAGFVWDDDYNVTRNDSLRSMDGMRQIWFVPQSSQQYYPLMYTTFWAEYRLWGFNPFGYHFVNLALHAVAVILTWRLLLRLSVPGAWLASAIFAVHPVMVESVVWVTERKNVLSLSFALGAMLCYLRFAPCTGPAADASSTDASSREEAPSHRWRWYSAALALFALALASKTMVVTMPAVLLVVYWWKRGRIGRSEIVPLLPFFALSVAAGLITVWMELYHVGAKGDDWSLNSVERVLLAGRALWFYMGKLVWPYPLVFFYPRWDVDDGVWWQYLFPAAAVLTLVVLWIARNRIRRGPLAAALIYAGILTPALGFVNIYYMQFAYVADHFQYHAAIALIAMASAGATLWARKLAPLGQRWAQVAAAALLVVLIALSIRQSQIYENQEALYRNTIAQNPRCWMAYLNLDTYLDAQGRSQDSLELLQTCIARLDEAGETGKYKSGAERNLGFVLMELGRHADAKPHFEMALSLTPDDPKGLYGLGMANLKSAEWAAAKSCFARAIELDPTYADGFYGMGVALANQNQLAESVKQFEQALELNPADPLTHFELANALARQNRLAEAVTHYRTAVQLRPSYPEALHNLGVVELNVGDQEQGVMHLRMSLRLNPDNAAAKSALEAIERGAPR